MLSLASDTALVSSPAFLLEGRSLHLGGDRTESRGRMGYIVQALQAGHIESLATQVTSVPVFLGSQTASIQSIQLAGCPQGVCTGQVRGSS